MTDIGLFDGRHVELLEGTLYEMPPMGTPHLLVLVRLQRMLTSFNAAERLLVRRFEVELLDPVTPGDDHPGLFRMGGVYDHLVGHVELSWGAGAHPPARIARARGSGAPRRCWTNE